jgi:hypothetical protein
MKLSNGGKDSAPFKDPIELGKLGSIRNPLRAVQQRQ